MSAHSLRGSRDLGNHAAQPYDPWWLHQHHLLNDRPTSGCGSKPTPLMSGTRVLLLSFSYGISGSPFCQPFPSDSNDKPIPITGPHSSCSRVSSGVLLRTWRRTRAKVRTLRDASLKICTTNVPKLLYNYY